MTDDELAAIEARANASTPGPWTADKRGGGVIRGGAIVHKARGSGQPQIVLVVAHEDEEIEVRSSNVAFIAASREDVPALVAKVRRLQAERDAFAAKLRAIEEQERKIYGAELENHQAMCALLGRDSVTDRAYADLDAAVCMLRNAGHGDKTIDDAVSAIIAEREESLAQLTMLKRAKR